MTSWPREFHRQILDEVRVASGVVVGHMLDADVNKAAAVRPPAERRS